MNDPCQVYELSLPMYSGSGDGKFYAGAYWHPICWLTGIGDDDLRARAEGVGLTMTNGCLYYDGVSEHDALVELRRRVRALIFALVESRRPADG